MVPRLVKNYLVPFVFNRYIKYSIMAVFVGFLGLGVVGCFKLELGLEQQVSLITGSYLNNYFDDQFKYG